MLRRDAAGEPPLFAPQDPLQYSRFLIPDLPGKPWHDAADHVWTRGFEDNHLAIRAELEAFLAQQHTTFRNYVGPILHEQADAGEWHVLYMDYRGHRWDEHIRWFPTLWRLVETVPRRSGTVFVSRLTPGAHIPKHCGATNAQLTCHFGIVVPPGVDMRVAREVREQVEGRCTIFDDSFEHEVWNRSQHVRYNVFIQFWNPLLSDKEIAGIRELEQLPQIQGVIARYIEGASALQRVDN